jgi:hypothetical protein
VARRDAVHGVTDVRHLGSAVDQLIEKSYRPRSGGQRGPGKLGDALGELAGRADPGAPEALAALVVGGGERLAAARVEGGEAGAAARDLAEAVGERVEGAGAGHRHAGAGAERPGAGDPDPQAGEGPGADADDDPFDRAPAARGRRRALDLLEQPRRVAGAAVGREPEQGLMEDLAAARRADGGVLGRRVEADQRRPGGRLSRGL